MQGEDVFGYKISVNFAQNIGNCNDNNKHTNTPSPLRNKAWRKACLGKQFIKSLSGEQLQMFKNDSGTWL